VDIAKGPAQLRKPSDQRRRRSEFLQRACAFDIAGRKNTVGVSRRRFSENIEFVATSGIEIVGIGCEHRQSAVETLGARAAVRVLIGALPRVSATDGCSDQPAVSGVDDAFDDLSFCEPQVGISYGEIGFTDQREELAEPSQHARMGGASCPATDHLGANRKIQTDDAIFVKTQGLQIEHTSHGRTQGSEEERAGALGVFFTQ
jgi:hypothetical protein